MIIIVQWTFIEQCASSINSDANLCPTEILFLLAVQELSLELSLNLSTDAASPKSFLFSHQKFNRLSCSFIRQCWLRASSIKHKTLLLSTASISCQIVVTHNLWDSSVWQSGSSTKTLFVRVPKKRPLSYDSEAPNFRVRSLEFERRFHLKWSHSFEWVLFLGEHYSTIKWVRRQENNCHSDTIDYAVHYYAVNTMQWIIFTQWLPVMPFNWCVRTSILSKFVLLVKLKALRSLETTQIVLFLSVLSSFFLRSFSVFPLFFGIRTHLQPFAELSRMYPLQQDPYYESISPHDASWWTTPSQSSW